MNLNIDLFSNIDWILINELKYDRLILCKIFLFYIQIPRCWYFKIIKDLF